MNAKQQAFLEHYLRCWNAAEAARLAGYSVKSARQIGARLLSDDDIKLAITERLTELQMGANEVLVRLSQQARANMMDFVDRRGRINIFDREALDKLKGPESQEALAELELEVMRRQQLGLLVKKYKTRERKLADMTVEYYSEIELHDAQAALVHLGKHHRLFAEKFETWQDDLIRGLRDGSIKPKDVIDELGRDAASALFVAAGVSGHEGANADQQGGAETAGTGSA